MAEELIMKAQKDTVFSLGHGFLSMTFLIFTPKQSLDPKNDFVLVLGEEGRSQGLALSSWAILREFQQSWK